MEDRAILLIDLFISNAFISTLTNEIIVPPPVEKSTPNAGN